MKTMLYHNIIRTALLSMLFLVPYTAMGQDASSGSYTEKFVDASGINLHYLDFGGSGLPIIFLQSFHGDAREWVDYDFVDFAPRFTNTNRVYAITRRGWGKSADPGWGYDVATQAEDVIAFMDALKLEKAIMVGRIPGNMDMTWIAEHHPNRLAGIISIGKPYLYMNLSDPHVQKYVEMFATLSCDLGEDAIRKSLPRSTWRPHILYDDTKRIDIPALRFIRPGELTDPARELQLFDGMMNFAKTVNFMLCNADAQEYYKSLAGDTELQQTVKEALIKADRSLLMNEAIERAFGSNLKTVTLELPPNITTDEEYDAYWKESLSNIYFNAMIAFINQIPN